MQKKIEFRKIRDFGQVINDTFAFVRQNFKPLIKFYYLYCGFFVLATIIATSMMQIRMVGMFNGRTLSVSNSYTLGNFLSWEYFFAMIFSVLAYAVTQVIVVSFIKLYVDKGQELPDDNEMWGYVKYYILRVFGSSFLLILLLIFGLILCILPGIWLLPAMAIFFPIMMIENGSFNFSLSRMYDLIKNNWWETFGIMFVIWIIVYATTTFISLPTTILGMLDMFSSSGAKMSLTFTLITTVIQGLCQVFMILPVICATFCYYSLIERKESAGLMDKIDHFGQNVQDTPGTSEEY